MALDPKKKKKPKAKPKAKPKPSPFLHNPQVRSYIIPPTTRRAGRSHGPGPPPESQEEEAAQDSGPEMGVNGYLNLTANPLDPPVEYRVGVVNNEVRPFSIVCTDIETKYGLDPAFWPARLRAILDEGKTPSVMIGYGMGTEVQGVDYFGGEWNIRFRTELKRAAIVTRMNALLATSEMVYAEYPAAVADEIRPFGQYWQEPRFVNLLGQQTGAQGFDTPFLEDCEYIVPRLNMSGRQLSCFTLHGPKAFLKDQIRRLFLLESQGWTFPSYFDRYAFNYYPANDSLTTVTQLVDAGQEIYDEYRKYTTKPVDWRECSWDRFVSSDEVRKAMNYATYDEVKRRNFGLGYWAHFSIITPGKLW